MRDVVAELKGVSRSFGQGTMLVRALCDVDLQIHPGELTLIEGPSGSGKTTLLHIMGLLQRADEGEVWLNGRRVDGLSESELPVLRRENVALVFQGYNLLDALTVRDNITLAGLLRTGSRRSTPVADYLARFGLIERAGHLPAQLSGGEKQRTAIARALATNGRLILTDEPTANLDWANAQEVLRCLVDLAHRDGRAVVMVSHDSRLEPFADRIVGLLDGRVCSDEERQQGKKATRQQGEEGARQQGEEAGRQRGNEAARRQGGEATRQEVGEVRQERGDGSMAGGNSQSSIVNRQSSIRNRRRGAHLVLVLCFLVLIAVGVVVAVRFLSRMQSTPPQTFHAPTKTAGGPRGYVAAAPAVVEPATQLVALRAERRGRIKAILKRAGDPIEAGEPLVLLDDVIAKAAVAQRRADLSLAEADLQKLLAWDRPEVRKKAEAGVERAQARLDRAARDLKRVQRLYEQSSSSDTELNIAVEEKRLAEAALKEAQQVLAMSEAGPIPEEVAVARAKVDQARAALHVAETELSLRTIVAPLDGHVVYRHLEPGEVVDPEVPVPILSIGNLLDIRLRAEVDEADIGKVKLGQTVVATAEALPDREFEGRVVHLEPVMGRKSIRTERAAELEDVNVREVLIEVEPGTAELPIDLQMTVRFLPLPAESASGR
jgi:putative ABC transport system ATP-binding protein